MAFPGPVPVTTPVADPTVAIAVLLLVHVPPLTVLVSVIILPWHTGTFPPIAEGLGFTVICWVALHPVGITYLMNGVPGATPVTMPVADPTVACAGFVLAQEPPV